jgi:hypothetical protein
MVQMELEKQRLLYEDKLKAAKQEKEALLETVRFFGGFFGFFL